MLAKLAYTIDLSFNIPKSEQEIGFQAYQIFKNIINLIALSKDHLDIIYNPFKKYDNISSISDENDKENENEKKNHILNTEENNYKIKKIN